VWHVLSMYGPSANDFDQHHRHNDDLDERPARDRRSPGSEHRITTLPGPAELRCSLLLVGLAPLDSLPRRCVSLGCRRRFQCSFKRD
jgi:hypothetical protein